MELPIYLSGGFLVLGVGWVLAALGEPAPVLNQLTEGVKRSAELIDAIYRTPLR
ncbi:hypothetical protein LJR175_008154 [Variovorax sp. LjRoot175]|uniref:hypothetical protein n=1 Tax=Variovorax sp. LjRoot175 TaxID=3342276 RepID=UPI003ECF76C4